MFQENLKKLVKNKQEIDSSEFLQLASSFNDNHQLQSLSLGMAFLSEMVCFILLFQSWYFQFADQQGDQVV